MGKFIKLLFCLSVFCLCFTSCNSQKAVLDPNDQKTSSNSVKTNEPDKNHIDAYPTHTDTNTAVEGSPAPTSEGIKKAAAENEGIFPNKKFDEVFYKGARFGNLDIIQEAAAGCGLDPKENLFKDLDNDGFNELLVRCELEGVPYNRLLLFAGDEAEGIKYLEDLSSFADLGRLSSFKTANMYGNGTNQIIIDIAAGTGNVVCILNYKNEKVSEAIRAGVGSSEVEAYVKDANNDGVEEVVEKTSFMDIQKHIRSTIYKWDGKVFKSTNKWEYAGQGFVHPSDPEKVVQNYIENMLLGVTQEETLKLVVSNKLIDRSLLYGFDEEAIFFGFNYKIEEKAVSLNKASYKCEDVIFSLIKSDGKWIIDVIKKDKL